MTLRNSKRVYVTMFYSFSEFSSSAMCYDRKGALLWLRDTQYLIWKQKWERKHILHSGIFLDVWLMQGVLDADSGSTHDDGLAGALHHQH